MSGSDRHIDRRRDGAATRGRDSGGAEVDAFLDKLARTPNVKPAGTRGRLIFGMDATASRQPTWDRASHLQNRMFLETAALGGLDVQLVFFRGYSECKSSPWVSDSARLVDYMGKVSCRGGYTQIGRILKHCAAETRRRRVNALVYVGDCMEEKVDDLAHLAGELGVLGVPCFVFQEGAEPYARMGFQQIAHLSGGAYCSFDASSARALRDLLSAVAVYAAGGRPALEDFAKAHGGDVALLTGQLR
ncbi:VWA domain-containing protein [Marinibaculum pumilum]|uniref:VWA domain-containing protein n=1 Tax=Marinibaculum pumilum TaxID=1766165 RepID=A0ABV7KZ20_9PROT